MKTNWKAIAVFASAYVAMCVGASFGTGQELLQFFASYGVVGSLGAFVAVGLTTAMLFVCLHDSRKHHITSGEKLFIFYGGKYLGRLLYWYTILSCFLSGILLLSGAGATAEAYFGIPAIAGRAIMAVLVVITVVLGLNKLVDVIGRLGFLILLFMMAVAIISIINPADGMLAGTELAKTDIEVYRPASNWIVSGSMYFTWCVLVLAAYVSGLVTNTKENEDTQSKGLLFGNLGFALCAALPALAITLNYSVAGKSQIPNIAMASRIHPVFGLLFSIIVIVCIYTTICPYIWLAAFYVGGENEKSMRYKITAIAAIAVGFAFSGLGSFAQIVSIVTGLSARVGYVFLACIIITKLFRKNVGVTKPDLEKPAV